MRQLTLNESKQRMILVGTASKVIASGKINVACTGCGELDSTNVFVIQQYGHAYYIPIVPSSKKATAQCSNCNFVVDKLYFPESYNKAYERLNLNRKTPIWTYSGIGILIIIIAISFISAKLDNIENAEFIVLPQKGDIYEIKLSPTEYTLYKVDRVEGNAVYIFENEFATDQSSGLKNLYAKPFYKESLPVMKSNLEAMLKKGDIMDIERQ